MSQPFIRRRSLPDSLRWLADKLLADDLSAAERAGIAVSLQMLADEAVALVDAYAHEVAERARRGVTVLEEHVGGFQYAREMREIIDVVDPTTPDPEGWDF